MRRSTRQVIGLSVMIVALAPVTWLGPNYFLNVHTPFCPWLHKLRENSVCVVLDSDGRRTLIQHANLESHDDYLEIRSDSGSAHYELPESVTALAPLGYSGTLLPDRDSEILIDGRLTRLVARP